MALIDIKSELFPSGSPWYSSQQQGIALQHKADGVSSWLKLQWLLCRPPPVALQGLPGRDLLRASPHHSSSWHFRPTAVDGHGLASVFGDTELIPSLELLHSFSLPEVKFYFVVRTLMVRSADSQF